MIKNQKLYNQKLSIVMQSLLNKGRIKPRIIFRFILVGILSTGFLLYRFIYKPLPTQCYSDAWHEFTADLNNDLDYGDNGNVVIGIGQVLMDFWIVAISVFWLFRLKNARVVLTAALFFSFRSFLLQVLSFPFPEHIVWHSPGFLSLTVPYDRTRDFFYSGHTGSLTIIILEFYTNGFKWFTLIPLICLVYMMNMLLLTRVHYTIDIAGGLIYAFFFYGMAEKIVLYFDWLLSGPFVLGKKIYTICRERKKKGEQGESRNSLKDGMLTNQH